jgi:hypothetical protein
MCRNITPLHGLEPRATPEEIEAAAVQFVRKISGVRAPSARNAVAFDRAVARITEATTELLATLPERSRPPATLPPMRRKAAAGAQA